MSLQKAESKDDLDHACSKHQSSDESRTVKDYPQPSNIGQRKDSNLKAIVLQNLGSLIFIGSATTLKKLKSEGFHIMDFIFLRNCAGCLFAWSICLCNGMNPFKSYPWDLKYLMFFRCLAGLCNFALVSLAIIMAPMSLVMIFFTT